MTPGPWHRRIGIIGNGTALSQEEQICSDDGVGVVILRHDGSKEGNANVQVMTVSPELLEALEGLLPDVEAWRQQAQGHETSPLLRARAAAEKARRLIDNNAARLAFLASKGRGE